MKIMIMMIVLSCVFSIAKAQNGDARPLPINWNDTTLFMPKQSQFYLGWQWAGPRSEVNSLLHATTFQSTYGGYGTRVSHFPDIPNDGGRKSLIWQNMAEGSIVNYYPAIQIDPTAPVHPVINQDRQAHEILPPREGDSTGAIYGFSYRDTTYGELPAQGDTLFDRYILKKTGVPPTGIVVLNEPTLQYSLFYNNEINTTDTVRLASGNRDTIYKKKINGSRWYLSINLRRTVLTDILSDDSVVMIIKLPYMLQNGTKDTLLFDSIPRTIYKAGNVDTLPFGRGIALKLRATPSTSDSTEFVITRRMLPPGNTQKDITISAYIRLKDTINGNTTRNPELQFLNPPSDPSQMTKAGMTVRYYGRSTVGIDWFRFEVPYSQLAFRGYLDTSHIGWGFNWDMDGLRTNLITWPNLRFLSYYGFDDFGGVPMMSVGERYMSRLMSGRWMSYVYGKGQRYNIIQPNNRWTSESPTPMRGIGWGVAPSPPFSFLNSSSGYGGMTGGWGPSLHTATGVAYDSLTGSSIEMALWGNCLHLRDTTAFFNHFGYLPDPVNYGWIWGLRLFSLNHRDTNSINWKGWYKYPDYLVNGAANGALVSYEASWYGSYKTDSSLAFSGQPWWANVWIGTNWTYMRDIYNKVRFRSDYSRPSTGEEARLQMWGLLINGCKGLMFERMYHAPSFPDTSTLSSGETGSALLGAMNSFDDHNVVTDSMLHHWGDRLFDSTMIETGGDFIVQGDSTLIYQYLDSNKVKDSCGVTPNRFYIGRLSVRHEVKRVCDLIGGTHGIGDTLMNLRLKSTWYKGFEETSVGDTSLFKKYVLLDTTKLRTRPIGRSTYDDADSSFVNATLLFDSTQASDKIFYIGALNPRTSPYVWLPDTDSLAINRPDTVRHSSHPGQVLTFLTTIEFEDYVRRDKLDKYSQSGAREITIPFNYSSPHGYALLRVKEIGGGIDTVIGQDGHLAVNFLPGEGKMLSVTVLQPDTNVTGLLQYSNQRKMIGYPILRSDGTPSDSIYYHLTYHRYDSLTNRYSVYYRRSNPVSNNSSSENIQWQPELLLSSHIRIPLYSNTDTIMRLSCAYPSVVVRYDSTDSVNKAYIVYSCESPSLSDSCYAFSGKNLIVENQIRTEDSSQHADTAEFIEKFTGSIYQFGTPMINASALGNYYCWPDTLGIIWIAWKPSHARYITAKDTISWAVANGASRQLCRHPSMNSYSRISLGEKDCALVWEESINMPIPYIGTRLRSQIFYTRLRMIGDSIIQHYLPPRFVTSVDSIGRSNDGRIARMSHGAFIAHEHLLPSVYRELVDSVLSGSSVSEQKDHNYDCLAWEVVENTIWGGPPYSLKYSRNAVYRRTAEIYDSSSIEALWSVGGICRLWSGGSNIGNPSISQGVSVIASGGSSSYNNSDSAVLMSVNEYTKLTIPVEKRQWHIRSNINYLFSSQDTTMEGYSHDGIAKIVAPNDAEFGQTAAFPRVGNYQTWRKNRRIYEDKSGSAHSRLQTSPRYFLKTTNEDETVPFNGFSDGLHKYMLSNPLLDNRVLRLNRVNNDTAESRITVNLSDTLATQWFTVEDNAILRLKSIGANADLVNAVIERRSDGELFGVELGTSDDTTALWTEVGLHDGGGEEYRLKTINKRTQMIFDNDTLVAQYGEEIVLGGIETNSSSYKRSGNQLVNLGHRNNAVFLRVYPNPAENKITVQINNISKQWHIRLVSTLGKEMYNSEINSSMVEINTSQFSAGVYCVIVENDTERAVVPFVVVK